MADGLGKGRRVGRGGMQRCGARNGKPVAQTCFLLSGGAFADSPACLLAMRLGFEC